MITYNKLFTLFLKPFIGNAKKMLVILQIIWKS